MNSKTKLKLIDFCAHFIVALVIVLAGLITRRYINPLFSIDEKFLILFVEYLIYYLALRALVQAFKEWRCFDLLYKIVSFPEHCYPLFIKPYLKIGLGFIYFILIFALLNSFLSYFPENIGYDWSYATKAFIGISLSAILLRSFGNTLIKWTFRWGYKSDNRREHTELTLSIINEQRIRYFIYLSFFVLLIWYTLIDLENPDILAHANESKAVLSAFGVFIAFDRLLSKWELIGFSTKKHAKHLLEVYLKDSKYKGEKNYLVDYLKDYTSDR